MKASQKRALASHRQRLAERGLARYEVRGLPRDKELIRGLAKRLAKNDAAAARLRRELSGSEDTKPRRGGSIEWIRSSPLVGADLNLEREVVELRDLDL